MGRSSRLSTRRPAALAARHDRAVVHLLPIEVVADRDLVDVDRPAENTVLAAIHDLDYPEIYHAMSPTKTMVHGAIQNVMMPTERQSITC